MVSHPPPPPFCLLFSFFYFSWSNLFVIVFAFFSLPPVRKVSSFLAANPVHGKIAGVGSVESSFLFQVTRSVESFDHPDLAAIMVFLECLTTLEVREFSFGVEDREIPGSRTFLFR